MKFPRFGWSSLRNAIVLKPSLEILPPPPKLEELEQKPDFNWKKDPRLTWTSDPGYSGLFVLSPGLFPTEPGLKRLFVLTR
jgi:hypothetical protein